LTVVLDRLDEPDALVIEGDHLLPSLIARPALERAFASGRLQIAVLHEPEETRILTNLSSREPEGDHAKRAKVSFIHSQWLVAEARKSGVPVVVARPWDRQLGRLTDAIR
jgi:2-phosphoglycerate kinase